MITTRCVAIVINLSRHVTFFVINLEIIRTHTQCFKHELVHMIVGSSFQAWFGWTHVHVLHDLVWSPIGATLRNHLPSAICNLHFNFDNVERATTLASLTIHLYSRHSHSVQAALYMRTQWHICGTWFLSRVQLLMQDWTLFGTFLSRSWFSSEPRGGSILGVIDRVEFWSDVWSDNRRCFNFFRSVVSALKVVNDVTILLLFDTVSTLAFLAVGGLELILSWVEAPFGRHERLVEGVTHYCIVSALENLHSCLIIAISCDIDFASKNVVRVRNVRAA